MADGRTFKRIPKSSKYKYVAKMVGQNNYVMWIANCLGASKHFENEKEAAKWVDLRLISKGKQPVNVLVKK
jgi:hypothetical protein